MLVVVQQMTKVLCFQGFRKIDTDRWEFSNDGFIRGQPHLLQNIPRRKYSQTSDQRKAPEQQDISVSSCEKAEKVENSGLWKEVECLKVDKNALMQELVKLRQQQETAESKLMLLKDNLQGMESSQQQLLSFLVMAMQNPSFLFKLLQPKEKNWRMAEPGNMLDQASEDGEQLTSDGMIVRYQPSADRISIPVLAPGGNVDHSPQSRAEPDETKDFWMGIDFMKKLTDESHIPFIPPDLYDDGAWERLLLASPLREDEEDGRRLESEVPHDCNMVTEVTEPHRCVDNSNNYEALLQHIDSWPNMGSEKMVEDSDYDSSENLELLTEKMGHLSPINIHSHG